MYNKLFTKILDSSVWLESATTRLVWLTLIASMDEDGFCAFAAMGNLANRARVPLSACETAVKVLESPDPESADPDHDGRRIERVPGGWMVLNAQKYRDMVTRVVSQERTRERVRKHRAAKAGNAPVTVSNDPVTQSEAQSEADPSTDQIKTVSLEPLRDSTPILLTFPTVGKISIWNLTSQQVNLWQAIYPNLDVLAECRKASAWIQANCGKRKTARGMPNFLVSWLNRSSDRPRGSIAVQVGKGQAVIDAFAEAARRKIARESR